jgi:hypothetical protein
VHTHVLCTIAVVLFLGGCASAPPSAPVPLAPIAKSAEQVVAERAGARWQALIKGDLVAAYGFLSPASRETINVNAFVAQHGKGGQFWRNVSDFKATCEAELCQVALMLEYDLRDTVKGLKREIRETWIQDQGQWWMVASQR